MEWQSRLRAALLPGDIEDDVIEELAQHAAAMYASARAEGCETNEALRRVDQQIAAWAADPAVLRRRPKRPAAVVPPGGARPRRIQFAQDVRYAWRLLRRQPGYAALVVATLALGIAATTVLGSVTYGVLLKPLPWADAPRLVRLYESRAGSTHRFGPLMTNATYVEWQRNAATLDAIGGWGANHMRLTDYSDERIKVAEITASLFPVLQAAPAIGRAIAESDEEPGRQAVLLSDVLWRRRFGARTDMVGQVLRIENTAYTIIGVMPAGFVFPDRDTLAWIPFRFPLKQVLTPPGPGTRGGVSISMFQAIGRLRPGITPAQAAAEGTARGSAAPNLNLVSMAVFGSNGAVEVTAIPMLDALVADVRPAILIMLAAVGLLLLVAVANATSLQLARATARRRELAIRSALGAGRGRLVRQTLVENLLLGVFGGLAGLALAALMHRIVPTLLPADFPRLDDLAFDWRIQTFAVAVSLAAGLGCGLLPALHVARGAIAQALAEDGQAPIGSGWRSRTGRTRAAIMTAQVAIACVLLVGATLLLRSFTAMLRADVGYDPRNVLTAEIELPVKQYPQQRRKQILYDLVERLAGLDGVSRAAFGTAMPFSSGVTLSSFSLRTGDGRTVDVQTGVRQITAGYFAALGQRLVEGREFTSDDSAGAVPVVIVNREFARRYLENRALGATLPGESPMKGKPPLPDRVIVGVVENTVRHSVTDTPEPEIYIPSTQAPVRHDDVYVIARTAGDPRLLVPALRSIARQVAPGAAVDSIMTMDERRVETLTRPRLYAALLGTFAVFALLIAAVGLFGLLSYSVAQRTREIGVRAALGAQVRDIVGLVLRQSMAIACVGVATGLLASFSIARVLEKFLFGVTAHDRGTFAAVGAILLLVSVSASIVPARRAARVDPITVLRA